MTKININQVFCQRCGEMRVVSFPHLRFGYGKYCSSDCYHADSKKEKVTRRCGFCGREFVLKKPSSSNKYCSSACVGKAQSINKTGENHPNWKGGGVYRLCMNCGKSFTTKSSFIEKGHGVYCSRKCYGIATRGVASRNWRGGKVVKDCEFCGHHFSTKPSNFSTGRGKYCSRECAGLAMRGEGSARWVGDAAKMPENKRIRGSAKYQEWRKAVFARDNWTCQDCGVCGCYLHAHHIFPFADFPEHRLDVWNGIALCVKCHAKVHPNLQTINSSWGE